jgi:hypothetical protein
MQKTDTIDFLERCLNRVVEVTLVDGTTLTARLLGFPKNSLELLDEHHALILLSRSQVRLIRRATRLDKSAVETVRAEGKVQ